MDHAITVGELAYALLIIGGSVGVLVFLFWLVLWVFNPWRSGH